MAIEHADFEGIERLALVLGEKEGLGKEMAIYCSFVDSHKKLYFDM